MEEFDTPSTWGGGATFSSGLAPAKVISSDDNAEPVCAGGACNITHLAHEFGHVMTLCHPGSLDSPAHMALGTSGTLNRRCDVTPDGSRFLIAEPLEAPVARSLTLVQNWARLVRR